MQLVKRTEINMQKIKDLSQLTGLDAVIVRLLMIRGIDTEEKINAFLHSDKSQLEHSRMLKNIPQAKAKILNAISNGQPIVIYADYDCDGIGAGAILYLTLNSLGAETDIYIPVRHGEGYGLNVDAMDKIYDKNGKCLLVTVDCGISANEEIDYAISLGMDVIITDHHEPGRELPDVLIINPHLNENFTPLCGAGVAFKLAQELAGFDFAESLLDICAISTIADVVPLVNENRLIVKFGLEKLSQRECRIGLQKLIEVSEIRNKKISSADVAFRLAPRLNAAGRLSSALKAFNLLVTDDDEEANALAHELDRENKERQDKCLELINDVSERLVDYDLSNNYAIVLSSEEWEEGVIGIAASKISETFHRPALLFVKKGDVLKGSGRSISGVNLYSMLEHCSDLLIQFGGHAMAAGMTIEPANLNNLSKRMNSYMENSSLQYLERKVTYDSLLSFELITKEFVNQLAKLEPYGLGNPKPVFVTRQKSLSMAPMSKASPHLKQLLHNRVSLLGFNMVEFQELLNSDSEYILVYSVDADRNRFCLAQGVIKDIIIENFREERSELLHRYLQYYTWDKAETPSASTKKSGETSELYGTLYVSLTLEDFVEFIEQYPELERYVYHTANLNPYNAAVLLPGKEFPFSYYSKIVFLEKPSDNLVKYIAERFSGEIVLSEEIKLSSGYGGEISIDMLRESFLIMARTLNGISNPGLDFIYEMCAQNGFSYEYEYFIIVYNVFMELGLLCITEDDIITFTGIKVELTDSEILKIL